MNRTGFTVDEQKLASYKNNFATDVEELRNELDSLMSEMQELNASWKGPANDTFRTHFQSDMDYAEVCCKTFDRIVEYMDKAQKEYVSCESRVRQEIAKIR